ncbi:MAG: hypothetical protein AABW99_04535 [archaeon]
MDVLKGVSGSGRRSTYQPEAKCMNCGKIIDNPEGGIYNRRFCSEKCTQEYLGQ